MHFYCTFLKTLIFIGKSTINFFFSSFNGDTNELELGDEMEYTLARKSSKVSAENIRKLNKGTIPPDVRISI